MVHISNIKTLKAIYYAHFHSVINYAMIFGGNSSNSGKVFTLQKQIIRFMAGAQPIPSCRSLFKQVQILPAPCQYILLLMNFVINNQEIFQTNSFIHNINTRKEHHLHRPNATLSCSKKKYILWWHKNFQQFATCVTILKNEKAKFQAALIKYLHTHTFYLVD